MRAKDLSATELMIGDWVINHYYQDKEYPFQFGVGDMAKGGYNHVEPIPLTVEILEENGFFIDHIDCGGQYEMYDGRAKCENIQQIGDHWGTSYSDIDFKYVHEFQHYLRLTHNDLANNFKVNK